MAKTSISKKSRPKTGKPRKRFSKKQLEEEQQSSKDTRDNDVSWYSTNPFLLRDAATLAFSDPAGMPIQTDLYGVRPAGTGRYSGRISFPGICAIHMIPSVGYADSAVDPVNNAARNLVSYMRSWNSGRYNYDAPNLMLYLLAMDNIYSIYSYAARAYGLIRTFAQRNRFLPEALFAAMGLNYTDFMQNQAKFRYFLNAFAERAGSMCVPATMSYFTRHMWLYQNVFTDGQIDKSQLYVYVPYGFLQYDPVGHNAGTSTATPCLKFREWNEGPWTGAFAADPGGRSVDSLITLMTEMLDAVLSQEDFNIMSGDILKAFGVDKIWSLVPIHEDYDIIPLYSEEVLMQIENCVTLATGCHPGDGSTLDANVLTEGKDVIYEVVDATRAISYLANNVVGLQIAIGTPSTPTFQATAAQVRAKGWMLNMHKMDVTPEDVMVATRLMTLPKQVNGAIPFTSSNNKVVIAGTFGSEIPLNISFWRRNKDDLSWERAQYLQHADTLGYSHIHAEAFAQHPLAAVVEASQTTTSSSFTNACVAYSDFFGQIENFRFIDSTTLSRIHEAALLSMFAVPAMGSFGKKE